MPSSLLRTVALCVAAFATLSLTACADQSRDHQGKRSDTGQDLSALQGRWEQLPEAPGGSGTPRQRVIKEVNGDSETVTTYGPNVQVLHAQSAEFRLSRSGPVRVYTVQNPRVTGGTERGATQASPAKLAYVYRVHGNEFDEVWGLLPGQEEREIIVKRWRREGSGSK